MQEMQYSFHLREVNRHSADPVSSLPEVQLNMTANCKTNGLYLNQTLCTKKDKRQKIQL